MSVQLEIILTAFFATTACVIPGVFLVLRRVALMSDAISHAILLGIVLAFFAVKNLHSPILLIAAALTGVITVTLTEMIIKTKLLKKDAAIGLVFPALFSLAILLIHRFADAIHLDQDAVILGELAFIPFDRLELFGTDLGPIGMWTMLGMVILNGIFMMTFYKELKLATFDTPLAAILGFSPVLIHYLLMTLVSVTAVASFEVVGSILVVALMITPPATAYLLTRSLDKMIWMSIGLGGLASVFGYGVAALFDISIAGSMATMTGLIFVAALAWSPEHGLVIKYLRSKELRLEFSARLLLVQLLAHENTPQEEKENTIKNMVDHMGWSEKFAHQLAAHCVQKGCISREKNKLFLTPLGREQAKLQIEL